MRNQIADKITILNRVTLESLNETEKVKIVKNFTEASLEIVEADFGFAWWKNSESEKYQLAYQSPDIPYKPNPPRKRGGNYKASKSGEPFFVPDANKEKYTKEYDVRPYMKSYVIIPIVFQDKSYGNIVLCFKKKRAFSKQDKSICAALGNALAQALTINRLYSNLKDVNNTLDNTLDSIFIFEPKKLKMLYANQGAVSLLGKKRNEILKKNLVDLIDGLSSHDLMGKMKEIEDNANLRYLVFETWIQHPKNGKIPVEISLEHIEQTGQTDRFLAIVRDIGERKQSQDTIRKMAYYDALTGLPNRALLNERIAEELARAKSTSGKFALIFLDLDRFKVINDIYGHQIGDQLLRVVAQRLQKTLPRKATISRMGGDEFLILIPKLKEANEVLDYARKIHEQFLEFFQINDQEVYANCSIGMAVYPQDGEDVRLLLKHVDVALHRAKEQGGSNYQQYNSGLPMFYSMQPKMEKLLRQAIKKNELVMHYQPLVSVKTKKVVGCEALVRWNHPEMGLLYPDSFIGHAEESGLIVQLGEWILNDVCKQIKQWYSAGCSVVPVSVNVSPRELLRPTFVERTEHTIRRNGISTSDLKLELTETFLMKNIDLSVGILEQLKLQGIKILIDDFGTGYASLNYLKRLPIDSVKIDRTFIQGSGVNLQDAAITSAIIVIAHHLGLDVIAEGVELKQQLEMLEENNCDTAQGNYFYKPMPAQEFTKLLKKKKK